VLIEFDQKIKTRGHTGSTPLHDVARKGHREVVELLISAGASLSVEDKEVIKTSVKLRQSNDKPFK
jgi:ankyrin repeat protein